MLSTEKERNTSEICIVLFKNVTSFVIFLFIPIVPSILKLIAGLTYGTLAIPKIDINESKEFTESEKNLFLSMQCIAFVTFGEHLQLFDYSFLLIST